MLRDIAARWAEDPENTERGVLVSAEGPGCAQGNILLRECGYRKEPWLGSGKLMIAKHPETGNIASGEADAPIADALGITVGEATTIRHLNDETGRLPVEYLLMLAGQYEARENLVAAAGMVVGA